jgi:uncharacterized protein
MDNRLIEEVFEASDGLIVGRIRLQKIFYLLEQLGLKSGLRFSYHHYGPYSEELSHNLVIAEIIDGIIIEETASTAFGATYSIYKSAKSPVEPVRTVGEIPVDTARSVLEIMKRSTSVVIELAATIYWLKHEEKVDDWKIELKNRKPGKATEANMSVALKLLADINLEQPK